MPYCDTETMPGPMLSSSPWPQSAVVALLLAVGVSLDAADRLQPTFASEVAALEEKIALPLLRVACGMGVRTVTAQGKKAFGCGDGSMDGAASRYRTRRYPWMPYVLWEADGILFGHFLSPTSEDVAINCLLAKATRRFGAVHSVARNQVGGNPSGIRPASSLAIVGECHWRLDGG